jgi:hypothetical protein
MAENLPHLNIKTRHADKPKDKAEVARLNNILKTWTKNKVLATETRSDDKRRPKDFYIAGQINDETPGSAADTEDDQIVLQ